MESELPDVRIEATHVAVEFQRPQKRNALTHECATLLTERLRSMAEYERPLVLRSATSGMFVSGTDRTQLRARTIGQSLSRVVARLVDAVAEYPWPTIAVVDGAALGGGFELALACDFRVATEQSSWGLPEVSLGVIPSAGGLVRLTKIVGESMARDLVFTSRRLDADEAARAGIVSRMSTRDELDETVDRLIHSLNAASSLALRLGKEAMSVTGDRYRLVDATSQALCLSSEFAQRALAGRPLQSGA